MSAWRIAGILIPVTLLTGIAGVAVGVRFHEDVLHGLGVQAGRPGDAPAAASQQADSAEVVMYTCSMHPQVVLPAPGVCPICHMPLTPIHTHGSGAQVKIDPTMVQNMGVRTAMPRLGVLEQSLRAVGTLTEPEQNHREINLRVNGWIEKLYANQEGMPVNEGDPLFELYSPEITAAADELITARKSAEAAQGEASLARPLQGVLTAARRKLELLGLTPAQVSEIEKADKAPATVTIVSPMHGHIAEKKVIEGSAVKAGDELMRIADRSKMWLIVQVFEQQLGAVRTGEKVTATVTAFPGRTFEGKVDFVYPHLDASTRTAQVRVELANASHELHENMFAEAVIDTAPGGEAEKSVLVPREAVLDSGLRQIVFLSLGDGKFEPREVVVGRSGRLKGEAGGGEASVPYVEVKGITPDDTVVTSGQFLLDSESRLEEARQKLMTPSATK